MDTNSYASSVKPEEKGESAQPAVPKEAAPIMNGTGSWLSIDLGNGVRSSETFGKVATALAKAQLEFKPIRKENDNPAFRSKYADLATVISATQRALASQELAVIQLPNTRGKDLILTTMLVHSSGEWMASDLTMPATMRDGFTAQTIGSACTYARRYALQALIGVAADIDDDGNEASGVGSREAAQAVAQRKIAEHADKTRTSQDTFESGKAHQEARTGNHTPAIFYSWFDESQTARIEGDKALMSANKDILAPLWNATAGAVVADADQLESLKYQFEERNVNFKLLKSTESMETQLKKSIEHAKAKKA